MFKSAFLLFVPELNCILFHLKRTLRLLSCSQPVPPRLQSTGSWLRSCSNIRPYCRTRAQYRYRRPTSTKYRVYSTISIPLTFIQYNIDTVNLYKAQYQFPWLVYSTKPILLTCIQHISKLTHVYDALFLFRGHNMKIHTIESNLKNQITSFLYEVLSTDLDSCDGGSIADELEGHRSVLQGEPPNLQVQIQLETLNRSYWLLFLQNFLK